MRQKNSIKSGIKWVWSLFSSVTSIVGFFFLNDLHFIEANSKWIIVVCLVALFGCCFFRKFEWSRYPALFFGFFLLFSILARVISFNAEKDNSNNELLSDVTMCLIDEFPSALVASEYQEWLPNAYEQEQLVYFLLPSEMDADTFIFNSYSSGMNRENTTNRALKAFMDDSSTQTRLLSKYQLLILYGPYLKKNWNNDAGIVLSGSSISAVLNGIIELKNNHWESAKSLFEKADSMGNVAGTYELGYWYEKGFGRAPDIPKSEEFYAIAADKGSREARVSLGTKYLRDSRSTSLQKVLGEQYLRHASRVSTIASMRSLLSSEDAVEGLNEYLRTVKRFRAAYKLTEEYYSYLKNPYVQYVCHLDNCISVRKYKEAMKIIRDGEQKGIGYCYLIHAGLLTKGKGMKRDYSEAEMLLKFAADSLDYFPAYRGLSELYQSAGKKGADFWEGLFNARFSNRIEK